MKALLAVALLAAPPPPPAPDLTSHLMTIQEGHTAPVPAGLANVRLSWKVADFIAQHASKEESETLGPDARGFRRFRVLASARAKGLDDVVVYFRENKVMLVAAVETHPIDDAGSWSRLVAGIAAEFGSGDTEEVPADRAKMLQTFALGEKGKSLKRREFIAWETPTAEIGALWLEDSWAKKRTYVITLSRTSRSAEPVEAPRAPPALTGLVVAVKAFFGEYNAYSTDLVSVNFLPEPGGAWVYGFCNEFPAEIAGIPGYDPKRNHTLHPAVVRDAGDRERLAALADPCAKLKALGLANRFQVTPHYTFTAFAIGNLDADDDVEVWSIDSFKNFERLRSDSE